MRDEYKKELRELKARMVKAEKWAEKMPVFKDMILAHRLSSEDQWQYGENYKSIHLGWGINRYLYKDSNNITNYNKKMKPTYLWNIYINTLSVYDDLDNFGLEELGAKDWFFYDDLNTTFYVTDDQIADLLESLNNWYLSAIEQLGERRKIDKVKELEAELKKLKDEG